MPTLKLPKLPDRTPIKHTIVVMPELEQKLRNYAVLYHQFYGNAETVDALIPFMLGSFLESDRSFAKALKEQRIAADHTPVDRRRKSKPSLVGSASEVD